MPRDANEPKRSILIYSPDLNFCFSLSMLFQDRYNVITTTNPECLETFADHYAADLVIVDAVPSEKMIRTAPRDQNSRASNSDYHAVRLQSERD